MSIIRGGAYREFSFLNDPFARQTLLNSASPNEIRSVVPD